MTDLAAGQPSLETSDIVGRTFQLLRASGARALAAVAAMAAIGTVLDLEWAGAESQIMATILNVALQFWLTQWLLLRLGLSSATRPRFIPYVLLGIVTGLGLIIGFAFLIVPGILLLVRWSIATPAVIASDASVFEAIGYSWNATRPHAWQILVAILIIYAPALLAVIGGIVLQTASDAVIAVIAIELALNAGLVAGWHMGVAIFAELQRTTLYSEVFA